MIKKVISFLLTFVFSVNAFCADSFIVLEDFSTGMKSHVSDYLIAQGASKSSLNVRYNSIYGNISKRQEKVKISTIRNAPIKSVHRYYKSDYTKYYISTSSTYMDYTSDTGTNVVLATGLTDSKRWTSVTYKDIWIATNGYDNVKKWDGKTTVTANTDGARTAENLITDLGAPFTELNTGSNLTAEKWYQYKIAYYNGSYYTYSSTLSNAILTGSTVRDIYLTDIPLGAPGTTHRYIYRTTGQSNKAALASATFYLVKDIADNSTTVLADTVVDTTADDNAAPTWATVSAGYNVNPPKSKYCIINQERLFLANNPTDVNSKSKVYYSPVYYPDYFYYHTDYRDILPDNGDEITFIKNLLGILTIGKTRSICKFYTTGSTSNWSVSDAFENAVGCIAPYSATNGLNGIYYLGSGGLYIFNGQSSELISDSITDKTRDILETNYDEVVACFNKNVYYLSYTGLEQGLAINDNVIIFDVTRNAYSIDNSKVDSFCVADSADDSGIVISGSSESDGFLYSQGENFSKLTYRYLSQFNGGTFADSYAYSESTYDTEQYPVLRLGDFTAWEDLDDATAWEDSGDWTWTTHTLSGTWTSPAILANIGVFDKLYWNERLNIYGNITFAIRTGVDETACLAATWSSEFSDPSGSDISALTANNYIQVRITLTSTSYAVTPELYYSDGYNWRITYKKSGNVIEPSFLSQWESGRYSFGIENSKRLKEIQVYYTGTSGTLTCYYETDNGNERSFNINLATEPNTSLTDSYFGTTNNKIYVHIPSFSDQPIGRTFKFKLSEFGIEEWSVKRFIVRLEPLAYTTFLGGA
jgi:hypothetical protein